MNIYLLLLVAGAVMSIHATVANAAVAAISSATIAQTSAASQPPAASAPSGSTHPPASSTPATTTSAAMLGPSDTRKVFSVDPRNLLSSYSNDVQLQLGVDAEGKNIQRRISSFPEPGYSDPNTSQFTVMRASDPVDASKKAFRHKIIKGMAYRQDKGYQSARAEIFSRWNSPTNVLQGVPYWAAFAFYVDSDHPFDGTGDDLDILELGHGVTSKNGIPNPAFYLRRNGAWDAMVSSNTVLNGDTSTRTTTKVFSKPIKKGVWNYIVVQFKLEWDVSKGPYFRVWYAIGNGPPVQIADTNVANAYRESVVYQPQKFGLYQWNIKNWGSSNSRTLYTKGLYIFRDQPGTPTLNVDSMLAFLRSI